MPSGVKLYNYDEINQLSKDNIPERWLIDTEGPLGWKAYDANAKLGYQLNDTSTINIAYQMWRQPQTPRYDKIAPQEFDEFFFEPQNRDLVYANYLVTPVEGGIDSFRLTASLSPPKRGTKRGGPRCNSATTAI